MNLVLSSFCYSTSCKEYDEQLKMLAHQLMDIVIEDLHVGSTHFEKYLNKGTGNLRWNYSPDNIAPG